MGDGVDSESARALANSPGEGRPATKITWKQRLPVAGIVAGVWATLPRFMGPRLAGLETSKEMVDHLIPGLLVVALSVSMIVLGRGTSQVWALANFVTGLGVVLAGLWMTATHIPLLAQARRHEVGSGAAWFHSTPGLVLLALGLMWSTAYWSDAAPEGPYGSDGTV